MANEPSKNNDKASPAANSPVGTSASSAASADPPKTTAGKTTTDTNAAGATTSSTPTPETPKGPLSPNTTTPGVGSTGGSSAGGPGVGGTRPVTTTPSYGDPTVDRLALEPADADDWVTRTKLWVEENPALAVVGAVGLGLLVGRIVMAAIPEPEPKTLTAKIEKRAHELAKQGRYYADDAGDVIARQLAVAADALAEASGAVSKNAKKGYAEAKDFSETVAEAIGQAFSKKAGDWIDKLT